MGGEFHLICIKSAPLTSVPGFDPTAEGMGHILKLVDVYASGATRGRCVLTVTQTGYDALGFVNMGTIQFVMQKMWAGRSSVCRNIRWKLILNKGKNEKSKL